MSLLPTHTPCCPGYFFLSLITISQGTLPKHLPAAMIHKKSGTYDLVLACCFISPHVFESLSPSPQMLIKLQFSGQCDGQWYISKAVLTKESLFHLA